MVVESILKLLAICLALLGHFGIWIALYNRINATGYNRKTIKRLEKVFVLACGVIPMALLILELQRSGGSLEWMINWRELSWVSTGYGVIAMAACVAMGPFWILDRPCFAISADRFAVLESEKLNQHGRKQIDYAQGSTFRRMCMLPGNQIVSLERNVKRIYLDNLPAELIGLRIAHLSDIHLLGELTTDYYRLAINWVIQQSPDLIVVSGDIVDNQESIGQILPVFEGLFAPYGRYFVLGNHDRRLPEPSLICQRLLEMGWTDLGHTDAKIRKGESEILLIGSEAPWFNRNCNAIKDRVDKTSNCLTIGVSHSPDQVNWGIKNRCNLLLCGHTHGGQIRFPWIGPIVTPSWFGTRYASGVFHVGGATLMHVSRGLSGVHPFRWGCLPEVTILELTPFSF